MSTDPCAPGEQVHSRFWEDKKGAHLKFHGTNGENQSPLELRQHEDPGEVLRRTWNKANSFELQKACSPRT